jgi:hydroxymethylpyrimidine pyrophosphatase-like HAD family hydrolase
VRELVAGGADVGFVACGKSSAYVERSDEPFLAECERYYARLEVVDDLLTAEDEWLKIAVFDFGAVAQRTAPALEEVLPGLAVVVSGEHWVDAMHPTTNKGAALRRVQEVLGVTRAQTAAFGDYHNDLELLADAEWSFAVANAHPDILRAARFVAPSNADHGVQQVLAAWLDAH